jgi:hypothetical protein
MASALRAGTVAEFANSLASYIDDAMQNEWQAVKGSPLPSGLGEEDRRILFAAIAQGVLKFLFDHRADLITTSTGGGGSHTHTMNFTVTTYRTPLPR